MERALAWPACACARGRKHGRQDAVSPAIDRFGKCHRPGRRRRRPLPGNNYQRVTCSGAGRPEPGSGYAHAARRRDSARVRYRDQLGVRKLRPARHTRCQGELHQLQLDRPTWRCVGVSGAVIGGIRRLNCQSDHRRHYALHPGRERERLCDQPGNRRADLGQHVQRCRSVGWPERRDGRLWASLHVPRRRG